MSQAHRRLKKLVLPRYIRIASSLWQMSRIVTDTKNVIEFKGHAYARLGFAPPSKAELEPSPSREEYRYCELPAGWELAPKDPEIVAEVIAKHYWGIQVLVVSDGTGYNTLKFTNRAVNTDMELIGFGPIAGAGRLQLTLSESGNDSEAAANLFDMLHAADGTGAGVIGVAPVPDNGLGEAINDRLRRAAAPRG